MSTLASEIDQTLQSLDADTAARLERLVRDALALVRPAGNLEKRTPGVRFPLVRGAQPISDEDVARLDEV